VHCKLVTPKSRSRGAAYSEFISHSISRVDEAYNNIVLHRYAGREPGAIRCELRMAATGERDRSAALAEPRKLQWICRLVPNADIGILQVRRTAAHATQTSQLPSCSRRCEPRKEVGEAMEKSRCSATTATEGATKAERDWKPCL
jgi:hypothetical protein